MKKRRQRVSTVAITARTETLSHDGRGIARIDGKATFIAGALPNETVVFQYTRQTRDFDEGRILSIVEPSPYRVEPPCPHYTECGGCSLQHLDSSAQVLEKQQVVLGALARIGHVSPERVLPPLSSNPWHYRNKARLSAYYNESTQSALLGFRKKTNPSEVADINQCSVLHTRVSSEINTLRALISSLDNPRGIPQVEIAVGDDTVALIFRHLTPLSASDEEKLRQFAEATHFRLFLQSGGTDSVRLFYPEHEDELLQYTLPLESLTLHFHPTDFTQINPEMNRLMVNQTLTLLDLKPDSRVLDLYCGLGNFSLPMAKQCSFVTGIEGSANMVLRAQYNAEANGLSNLKFLCADLDNDAVLTPFKNQDISHVLIDPPRTGALAIVNQMKKLNPQRIVYVSCNPATLARDADRLVNEQRYRLTAVGVMDMFPHTTHVESMALFEKG